MNYTKPKVIVDYMQEGGQIDPMQAIEQLVMAAMNNDQSAIQQINEIMQRAQQGDPEAQKAASLIQQMMEQTQSMKCGGKAKKAKKAQMGLPIKKCPCQLKRIGGRIVEVDGCTGLPYKKNGGRIQYGAHGIPDGITISQPTTSGISEFVVGSDGNVYRRSRWFGGDYMQVPLGQNVAAGSAQGNAYNSWIANSGYKYAGNGRVAGTMIPQQTPSYIPFGNSRYFLDTVGGQLYYKSPNGYHQIQADPDNPYYGKFFSGQEIAGSGYKYDAASQRFVPVAAEAPAEEPVVAKEAAPTKSNTNSGAQITTNSGKKAPSKQDTSKSNQPSTEKQVSAYRGYFADNGFGEYQSWQARKQFINDNKQWLTDQGFDANGYTGRPEQNAQMLQMLQLYKNRSAVNDPTASTGIHTNTPLPRNPERPIDNLTMYHPAIIDVPMFEKE